MYKRSFTEKHYRFNDLKLKIKIDQSYLNMLINQITPSPFFINKSDINYI